MKKHLQQLNISEASIVIVLLLACKYIFIMVLFKVVGGQKYNNEYMTIYEVYYISSGGLCREV